MINTFEDFNQFNLIIENLHINKEIDLYSDEIYQIITKSVKLTVGGKFEFLELSKNLNIIKLIINIKDMSPGVSGQLDLNKSKKTDNGWIIYIDLKKDFNLSTLKHELNHALRLTLVGKDTMIKNLNHIKSQNIFHFSKDREMEKFFYLMYLSNDEEINSKVMETNGLIKEIMNKWGVDKLSKNDFDYIIKGGDAFKKSNELINFKCDIIFKSYDENKLNKLFYILEENKSELDRIHDSKFSKLKMVIKLFRDIFNNKTGFVENDRNVYKPKRGKKFYDNYIPSQGEKLKRRIYSLYEHYNEK
jgi:hypothetical protein